MLELLLCFALATGITRAQRAGHRWALVGGTLVAYLLFADTLSALAGMHDDHSAYSFFNYLFLGPGVAPSRSPAALPLPHVLLEHPLLTRGLRVLACAAVTRQCLRESAALNPLLPRAYELDGIAMPFAGAGVIDTLEAILLVFAATLAARP